MSVDQIVTLLKNGTVQVIPETELVKKLESKNKLRIKLGVDPTAPDLHLGHMVVLSKLRQFQDLGHEIMFLIGDFTARIGDPTGKSKTRPPLDEDAIAQNTQTYFDQVKKVLDPEKVTIVYNSHWLGKLTGSEFLKLCAKVTLARLTEREDFAKRIAAEQPIGMHELMYPLLQGYDSVELRADVELGGTDQTFNLLMGRYLQEHYGQSPQVVITTPLLEGLDGHNKMSKSLGNAIGVNEPADQAFGKLMSISDTMMFKYMQLLLGTSESELKQFQKQIADGVVHPMDLKKQMAHDIVARFWSQSQAKNAQEHFEALFQRKDFDAAQQVTIPNLMGTSVWIVELLRTIQAIESTTQAKRLIESGAVHIDGISVRDFRANIKVVPDMTIRVGKQKFYKIV
ncbi:tyrosine--tRNA ligase [Vermiphilus pyriformis]|uniref:Tyrosine--tRNA ligase n=1 Tax=candidate division TM6 bacterium JCVI TM6SC1 TaxID=1306947 RepID=A0A0D2I159_9BACT|nr:hypothetical protein J120_04450 [candidate division TM6 bacterium JCVI TM6SC1]UNE35020.1 MAG: tyrosine--tRNA ligase [Vermiphilus pyriformis]